MQTVQLHELPFQFLIKLLDWIRFSDVLIWRGRLFQTFSPCTFKLSTPKVTWFHSGVSRFNFVPLLIFILFDLKYVVHKLWIYIFQQASRSSYLHSFLPLLLFLIKLHKMLSNHCINIETLFFKDFQFCSRI